MEGQRLSLTRGDAEPLAGAQQVAGGVADLHHQSIPVGGLEVAGEVDHLVSGTAGRLGRYSQAVVGVLVPRDNGLGGLDQMDNGAEVSGRLKRVVGRDHRWLAEEDPDA